MDDDLDRFRERVRCFLRIHATATPAAPNDDPRRDLALDRALDFQRALQAAGLAGLTVPAALGGHGLPAAYETAWREEAGRFPLMTEQLSITLGNCLPTLLQFGTIEQQCRHVPRILAGHEVWCQLFSEPEAGSDLAAVRTHAIAVGDGWIVNGQKIWTTLAHRADFGILLARTDTAAEKHDGLSMLIVDLRAPGVDIRPIRQLDGAQHFDEVFLTDVFVPFDAVLPPSGAGWRIASAMLHHQRVARATGQRGGVRYDRTNALLDEYHRRHLADPVLRDDLVRMYIAEVCQSLLVTRIRCHHHHHARRPRPDRIAGQTDERTRRPAVRPPGVADRGSGLDRLGRSGTRRTRRRPTGRAMGHRRPLHVVAVHRRRHQRDPTFDHRRTRPRAGTRARRRHRPLNPVICSAGWRANTSLIREGGCAPTAQTPQ